MMTSNRDGHLHLETHGWAFPPRLKEMWMPPCSSVIFIPHISSSIGYWISYVYMILQIHCQLLYRRSRSGLLSLQASHDAILFLGGEDGHLHITQDRDGHSGLKTDGWLTTQIKRYLDAMPFYIICRSHILCSMRDGPLPCTQLCRTL